MIGFLNSKGSLKVIVLLSSSLSRSIVSRRPLNRVHHPLCNAFRDFHLRNRDRANQPRSLLTANYYVTTLLDIMLWPSLSYGIIFLISNFQKLNFQKATCWLPETAWRVRSAKMSSKTASPTKEKFTPSARPLKCKYCWRRFKYRHAGSTVLFDIVGPYLNTFIILFQTAIEPIKETASPTICGVTT